MKPETLEDRLLKRIDRKRGDVFLRSDFDDLGGYDQVGRVLRKIVREGQLIRVGQGLYARARPSITSGNRLADASSLPASGAAWPLRTPAGRRSAPGPRAATAMQPS